MARSERLLQLTGPTTTEQPAAKFHVPAALVEKRRAEKAARESSVE